MGKRLEHPIGETFGLLTVLSPALPIVRGDAGNRPACLCKCRCGKEVVRTVNSLRHSKTPSCGCMRKIISAQTGAKSKKHGDLVDGRLTPEYMAWAGMFTRCYNANRPGYKYYGEVGVTVCERWRSYTNFLADMGRRPSDKHSIDRLDPNGNYEPSNCRWATNTEQANNRRNKIRLTFNGETKTVLEWEKELGISQFTIYSRIKRGVPLDKVLIK